MIPIAILVQLVVLVLVLGVLYFVVKLIAKALELPPVVVQIAGIVVVLVFALWLLNIVASMAGTPIFGHWPCR